MFSVMCFFILGLRFSFLVCFFDMGMGLVLGVDIIGIFSFGENKEKLYGEERDFG